MDAATRASLAKTFQKARESALQRDTVTFLGATPPHEVTSLATLLQGKVEDHAFRKIMQFVFEYMKGVELSNKHWEKLKEVTKLDTTALSTIFAGLLTLLRKAIRGRVSIENFTHDATEVLKIPSAFVEDMCAFIKNWHGGPRDIALETKTPKIPTLAKFSWRVDVTIMTSSLNRVLKPAILMQIVTSTGRIYTFECSPTMFHKLRYNVARLFKELDNVDNLPILSVDRVKQ